MTIEFLASNVTSTVNAVAITPHATANTKAASWTTVGTTTSACKSIEIFVHGGTAAKDYLVDISTGASPDIILNNLLVSMPNTLSEEWALNITLPLAIATSTAVKARCQANDASMSALHINIGCDSVGAFNYDGVTTMDTYGATTADSGGSLLDGGSSADTKNTTYTQLTASTTSAMKAVWIAAGLGGDVSRSDGTFLAWLATGAASSEVDFISLIPYSVGGNADAVTPLLRGPFVVDIATAQRLAGTCQSDTAVAGNRAFDIVVYAADTFAAAAGGGGGMKMVGSGGLAG